MSNMCIFSQLFIVFPFLGHPVWLKHTMVIYLYGSKDSQKAPGKQLHGSNFIDWGQNVPYS